MNDLGIGANSSCFLIKDKSLLEGESSKVYEWLEKEGFMEVGHKTVFNSDLIHINIWSKIYASANPGVVLTKVVGNHAITFDEFCTVYNIYKKYHKFNITKMNREEQYEYIKLSQKYKKEAF